MQWSPGKPGFEDQVMAEPVAVLSAEVLSLVEDAQSSGQLVSLLSNSKAVQAVLIFDDSLRPGVADMLTGLKNTAVTNFAVLSGDSDLSVSRLCQQLTINVYSC